MTVTIQCGLRSSVLFDGDAVEAEHFFEWMVSCGMIDRFRADTQAWDDEVAASLEERDHERNESQQARDEYGELPHGCPGG